MPAPSSKLRWTQRITIAFLVVCAALLLVVEGLSAETAVTKIGIIFCGALTTTALFLRRLVVPAVLASITFSIVCATLAVRLDNTFGIVELAALWWLMVWVVTDQPLRRMLWIAPALGVAVFVIPLRMDDIGDHIDIVFIGLISGSVFMVMLGLYMRLHEQRRAAAVALARETQRLEYARDLHDFVAHHVTAIVAQAKAVRYTTAAGSPPSAEDLDGMLAGIEDAGSEALASMRSMITVMRGDDPTPQRHTLDEVLTGAADRFPGPARVSATIDDGLAGRPLPPPTLDAARHVVQESLTNVLRHAEGVSLVEITARMRGGEVEIIVRDDGTASNNPSPGFGLVGLTERVEAIGGALTAGATAAGWQVAATLPAS
jgi:signal transduction histidine kinase